MSELTQNPENVYSNPPGWYIRNYHDCIIKDQTQQWLVGRMSYKVQGNHKSDEEEEKRREPKSQVSKCEWEIITHTPSEQKKTPSGIWSGHTLKSSR